MKSSTQLVLTALITLSGWSIQSAHASTPFDRVETPLEPAPLPVPSEPPTDRSLLINGQPLTAPLGGAVSRTLYKQTIGDEERVVAITTRQAGYRGPIHYHSRSVTSCLLEGSVTRYIDGQQPQQLVAGGCFTMPANTRVAVIAGPSGYSMLDVFVKAPDTPIWVPLESSSQFDHVH
jgi:quercetin dioxygenase-like cupin family protein